MRLKIYFYLNQLNVRVILLVLITKLVMLSRIPSLTLKPVKFFTVLKSVRQIIVIPSIFVPTIGETITITTLIELFVLRLTNPFLTVPPDHSKLLISINSLAALFKYLIKIAICAILQSPTQFMILRNLYSKILSTPSSRPVYNPKPANMTK